MLNPVILEAVNVEDEEPVGPKPGDSILDSPACSDRFEEPVGPKPGELILDSLACSDRFPNNSFAWLFPISLNGKFDLLKTF